MPRVVALYRYPVKGFTPQSCERVRVQPDGRIEGDRVLNLRFADAPAGDHEWCRKYHGIVLANTPGIARLQTQLDVERLRLTIALGEKILADERLTAAGRSRIAQALTEYVCGLAENPLADHSERLPLKLVGDGRTPRYQDSASGQVTLHSRETIASAAVALSDPQMSEMRFRSNIVIEGVAAWNEQSWEGRRVRIGEVTFETVKPKVRCLATHANPLTGNRDLPVMPTLVRAFAQKEPILGVGMLTNTGGIIAVGDAVEVMD